MINPCSIIFRCLAVGELVVLALPLSLPGSIIGMLLLTALLQMKLVRLEWVKPMSDFLVSNLGFFFIPPGVALMLYFEVIKAELWPIVTATLVSTVVVLVVTGWTHQLLSKKNKDKKNSDGNALH